MPFSLHALFGRTASPPPEATLDRLLKQRVILLGTPIDDAAANDVITKLLFLEMESAMKPIHLYINSPGGLVLAGLAIMDTMDRIRPPIWTHCLGTAHSMAAVILAYGRSGSRAAVRNSAIAFTLPQPPENADDAKLKDAERLGKILIAKTATATKRPLEEIRTLFSQDSVLTAEEAVGLGIVDRVVGVRANHASDCPDGP
jgi:ATP-dependent Clp protease, protease subunit